MLAVIDGFYWNEHLPWSIEAIIGSPGDPGAVRLHQRFLSKYHVSKEEIPLVTFHKDQADCPFRPFDAPMTVDPTAERVDYRVDGDYAVWAAPAVSTLWFRPKPCSTPIGCLADACVLVSRRYSHHPVQP